jgi:Zn-dependent peptidase ImmA (M78 family)
VKPPYFTNSQIEGYAESLRQKALAAGVEDLPNIELQDVVDFALNSYQLCLDQPIAAPAEGQTCFSSRRILISTRAESQPARKRFTIAHEIGHVVLHQDYMLSLFPTGQNSLFEMPAISTFTDRNLETQANKFASAFLLPRHLLLQGYERMGELFLQPRHVADLFGVSVKSAEIRLCQLKLLITAPPPPRLL